MQQGLDEDLYHQVSEYAEIGAFSEAEKLAAETVERFCWHHEAMIRDEDYWARMKEHFTDQQILELLTLIGYCVGMGGRWRSWRSRTTARSTRHPTPPRTRPTTSTADEHGPRGCRELPRR